MIITLMHRLLFHKLFFYSLILLLVSCSVTKDVIKEHPVEKAWAQNSINTVVFRRNSLVSHDSLQYISFYDEEARLVLARRNHGSSDWQKQLTTYKGNANDAHNSISIMTDGDGYLHVSWDHHDSPLRYVKTKEPGSLLLTEEMPMIGNNEAKVSYPEFYKMPNGNLLFFYRDGGSGNGNLVINHYDLATKKWERLQDNLIDGEGNRSAYWQACVDKKGTIHISWVWRESPNVASNHDMMYACSRDGGATWQKSNGEKYSLPITKATAEVIQQIPQKSELINQTAMTTNDEGEPYIISYWKTEESSAPQYQLIYQNKGIWKVENLEFRTKDFSLSGIGTKKIPISRPQIVISRNNKIYVIFRDAERNSRVSVAMNSFPFHKEWMIRDLTEESYGAWEPTLDTDWWKDEEVLSLFLQKTDQVDSEGLSNTAASTVKVLDWNAK